MLTADIAARFEADGTTIGSDNDFEQHFTVSALSTAYDEHIKRRGGRGIDRIGIDAFNGQRDEQLAIASRKVLDGSYAFAPYLEKLIARGSQRPPRTISIPTLRDRVVLHQLKCFMQGPFAASQERRLPNGFIRQLKAFGAAGNITEMSVIRSDISSFYDTIDHTLLLARVRNLMPARPLALISNAIRNPTLPSVHRRADRRGKRNPTGVPQGLAISNLLAGIYMVSFDEAMKGHALFYLRYVDDILIVAPSINLADAHALFVGQLAEIRLGRNLEKETRGPATDGFDYLGYRFQFPEISVRHSGVERFLRTIAARFATYRHQSLSKTHPPWLSLDQRRDAFIDRLNETITGAISGAHRYGWLFYYSEISDLTLLHNMDAAIANMFRRLVDFAGGAPKGLKKLSRAIFEVKYSPGRGYVHNYNAILTPSQRMEFLIRRGLIERHRISAMSTDEVTRIFERERDRYLDSLDRDVGLLY